MKRLLLSMTIMGLFSSIANAENLKEEVAKKALLQQEVVYSVKKMDKLSMYEIVTIDGKTLYMPYQGGYIMAGNVFDISQKPPVNISAKAIAEFEQSMVAKTWDALEKKLATNAIKETKGNGTRKMIVFTDPDCPFCKKLEAETLKDITNVTIYRFPLPLVQLHPDAPRKAESIWCSSDKLKAWNSVTLEGKAIETKTCKNPIEENLKIAQELGISGTPAIITKSKMVPGAIKKEALEEIL